jgi:ABC-2 type transport system ATP-binding protein
VLDICGVTKQYGRQQRAAIRDLSFSIHGGEILALVGLNGAGKTTTIRIAAGVVLPSTGDVTVEGRSITTEKRAASRYIGWVPETPIHDSGARIGQLIQYYSDLSGEGLTENARDQLEVWGVRSFRDRPFRTLSLGERKRFALAVACLQDPTYYLLDEIFNGLDPVGVAQVREWMLERRKARRGILASSHQLREVQALADRIAFLHEGKLIKCVEASQIPVSHQSRLQITFSPIDEAGLNILRSFGEVEQAHSGVTLSGVALDSGAVVRAMVVAGYDVSRLEASSPDLESFFLKLLKDAQ